MLVWHQQGLNGGCNTGGALWSADEVDEEDRRPTQRRRMEEAQAGGFDENMEPMVRGRTPLHTTHPFWPPGRAPHYVCHVCHVHQPLT